MPIPLIDKDEALWAACHRLQSDPEWSRRMIEADDPLQAPMPLAYGPVARRNQYQAMLYARAYEHGFGVMPLQRLPLFPRLPWAGPAVCHLHWVHELTAKAPDVGAAEDGVATYRRVLRQLKDQGHLIVWTVHNVLPHESAWPDHDLEVHRLCAPHYSWPAERELLVPHPSYERAQTDWIGRAQARASLEIGADEFVFLSFGAVLPYKGYDRVMRVFGELARQAPRRVRWLVAGQGSHPALLRRLGAWAAMRDDVTLDIRHVPHEDLQDHFRAADVALCPYERTLNSGAALMATSFGLPVVGPRVGGFVDNLGPECAFLYEPGSDDALRAAMEQALTQPLGPKIEASGSLSRRLAAHAVSQQFFVGLRDRLAARTAAAAAHGGE